MSSIQWWIFIAIVMAIIIYVYIDTNRKNRARIAKMLEEGWGSEPTKEYQYDEYENISHYFRNSEDEVNSIDDTTWNDLDMDRVFRMINNTYSSVGQEYLYKLLRTPEKDVEVLKERDRVSRFFGDNEKERVNVQKQFVKLGYASYISVTDYIDLLVGVKAKSNWFHVLNDILVLVAIIVCIFINPQIGILSIIGVTGLSIITYYKDKAKIEKYFICVKYIVSMVNCASSIEKQHISELKDYNERIKQLTKTLDGFIKNSAVLGTGAQDGSLAQVLADYFKMMTHFDLIKFNRMLKQLNNHTDDVYNLIVILGQIESSIAIASFRELIPHWCTPEFENGHNMHIYAKDVYHPLISEPVTNTIDENMSVLLTGSNASGKSTFLKTIAINAILAETIYTSMSNEYRANFFRVYSSMALNDDLGNNESYYIVEIKSLKRILDKIDKSDIPVLCFVDEVLRGTNTVERIAASSQILLGLSKKHVMSFAATHDIELTSILEKYYANYHFQEEVSEDDITFNYQLYEGKATSRNAIKLLGIIGYDKDIIKTSEDMAQRFIQNGMWSTI